MRLTIVHETHYRFAEMANHSIQYLRLTPRQDAGQRVLSWSVTTPGTMTPWVDGFGNNIHVSTVDGPHDEIKVVVEGVVKTIDTVGVLPARDGLPPLLFMRDTKFTEAGPGAIALANEAKPAMDGGALPGMHALTNLIADKIGYYPGATTTETLAEQAIKSGAGVCQDHAHIFIACARVLGLPARYVSGYILAGQDNDSHVASHAWAEVFIDGLGWVSFDPTNRQSATEEYVRLAIGFDYPSAAPIRGSRYGGGMEEMTVRVQLEQTQN
jgi:transglutaminase-like putative cysteine protease